MSSQFSNNPTILIDKDGNKISVELINGTYLLGTRAAETDRYLREIIGQNAQIIKLLTQIAKGK